MKQFVNDCAALMLQISMAYAAGIKIFTEGKSGEIFSTSTSHLNSHSVYFDVDNKKSI
jgi:hypothetical protein